MLKTRKLFKFGILVCSVFTVLLLLSACGTSGNSPMSKSKITIEDFQKTASELSWNKSELGPDIGMWFPKTQPAETLYFKKNYKGTTSSMELTAACKKYKSFEEAKEVLDYVKSEYESRTELAKSKDNIYWKTVSYDSDNNTILWKTTSEVSHEISKADGLRNSYYHNYLYFYVDHSYLFYVEWAHSDDYERAEIAIPLACELIDALGLPEW